MSVDVVGSKYSCVFDADLTSANGNLVKVMAWYDNERGYAERVCDLVQRIA